MKADPDQRLRDEKTALRERVAAARPPAEELAGVADALRIRLRTLPELAAARVVMGYAATATEVSIDAALTDLMARGVTVCLPWVEGPDLVVGSVTDLEDLAPGWRGVREPVVQARKPLRPLQLDVVLAPGVAFDAQGRRLGHGGGHYDRFLSRLRRGAVVVGICHDAQVVDRVPTEPHDRTVDLVVTPTRTLRPAPESGA